MLDTNVAIHLRDGEPSILARVERTDRPICLSVVTWVELEGGVGREERSRDIRRRALDEMLLSYPVVEFGGQAVLAYRTIISAIGFSRAKLLDRMIAAQALAADAVLATCNPRDFRDIPGLRVEDWSLDAD